jgi:hypothetical protein
MSFTPSISFGTRRSVREELRPESLRGYIERNAIALLSNYNKRPLDPPSNAWLGHRCNRERVRNSGLWNSNHVDETYDPAFLDKLDELYQLWVPRCRTLTVRSAKFKICKPYSGKICQ